MTDPVGASGRSSLRRANAALVAAVERAPIVIETTREAFVEQIRSEPTHPSAAHLTAIAWVFDPAVRHVLLVEHRLHGWSCPGGHVDHDEAPLTAARRELVEETGIHARSRSSVPLTISSSLGCARWPGARHWTLGFVFDVPDRTELRPEPDQQVAWFPITDPPEPRTSDVDVVLEHVRRVGLRGLVR